MKFIKNVLLYGECVDLGVEDGKIAFIGKTSAPGEDFTGCRVYPGLIDIHSHGVLGFDTMEGHLAEMADFELAHGITTWYPTTMTMSYDDIVAATAAKTDLGHGATIPGFHLEGPFINEKYKGAQNAEFITPPDISLLDRTPKAKIVTIAPELPGAVDFIREATARGIRVAVGHTDTDYDTAKAAFAAGATGLTHTYNAMPGIHHRAPGPIPAGAECEGIYAQLICDGLHVHPAAVRLLVTLFGKDRVVLISDSMRATGLSDGVYPFGGQPIHVRGGVAMTEDGHIAGSTTDLFTCVRRAISFGIPEEDAVRMASENPARHMGLDTKGRIAVGYDADLILVRDDFVLVRAIARGEF